MAENLGCFVWKYRKVIVFYSNDLAGTLSAPILDGKKEEAILWERGLLPIQRWNRV